MGYQVVLALVLASCGHMLSAEKIALLIVDIQNCFTPGGTLPVNEGDQVIDTINNLRSNHGQYFDLVVRSQDWHCSDHVSFASQHVGYDVYQSINLTYSANGSLCRSDIVTSPYSRTCNDVSHVVPQTLWPDHCVKGTEDAAFHPRLIVNDTDVIVRKGYRCQVDSYSVFYDNGGFGQTELQDVLTNAGITTVFIAGLARDFCVYFTAKDAKNIGLKTYVVEDATRPVSVSGGEAAIADMIARDIEVLNSGDVGGVLSQLTNVSPPTSEWNTLSLLLLSLCLFYTY